MKGFLIRFLKRAAVLWFGSIAGISLFYFLSDGLTANRFLETCSWVSSPAHAPTILAVLTVCDAVDKVGRLCERRGETFWQIVGGELRKRLGRLFPSLRKPRDERKPRLPWWAR